LTDSSGNVVERYVYDAYGNTTIYAPNGTTTRSSSSYTNYFAFTGRYYHSSFDIYYFRARYYDPVLGRFISRDPLGFVDGFSLYAGGFAANDVDPFGLKVVTACDISKFLNDKLGKVPEPQKVSSARSGKTVYYHSHTVGEEGSKSRYNKILLGLLNSSREFHVEGADFEAAVRNLHKHVTARKYTATVGDMKWDWKKLFGRFDYPA